EKYLGVVRLLFQQQVALMAQTRNTLMLIGKQSGLSEQAIETCEKDQALLDKLAAEQRHALGTLKVVSTPTFFVNDRKLQGSMSFEELEAIIKPMLKK
ncbi:MAG: thioredoxin domain-containing protein, partial [Bradyrhizobium sp.]